ncbi:MAG: ABC transporter substrate-binding protein, partial [Anaerolineae bacterium]
FKDSRVQTAVLHAAPWADMVDEVFGDPNLPVMTELDGQEIDARKMDYDPDRALEMLAEAGYPNGFGATLLVPQGDEQLVAMGDWLASILGEVGIDAGYREVPAADARATMAKLVAAGEAVLWLSRQ